MSTKKQATVKSTGKTETKQVAKAKKAPAVQKKAATKATEAKPAKKTVPVPVEAEKPTAKKSAKDSSGTDKTKGSMKKSSAESNITPDTKKKAKAVVEEKTAPAPKTKTAKAEPAPVKKAEPAKKVEAEPVKKAAAKKVEEVPVKKTTKPEAKPAPAARSSEKSASAKKASAEALAAAKRSLPTRSSAMPQRPLPTATPAARPIEKKPQVIIAHRKLENKSKPAQTEETAVNYQPEVYRSLLDEPAPAPVTVYRYSDEELVEFKDLITSRLEAARKELIYLQGVITRKDEAGTEDTENRYMNMEDGSGAMEREQLAQLASRQIQFVNHLEKALIRIENKTYGVCRVTGKLIEKARLRAVPHATLSIEAKKMMNTKQN